MSVHVALCSKPIKLVGSRTETATRVRLYRIVSAIVLVSWSIFMLYALAPTVWQSVIQLERFPETLQPRVFHSAALDRSAGPARALQAIVDARRPEPH